jgi:hypothetical protein
MDPITIALILAGLGAAGGIGGKIWGAKKESDYGKKMDQYNKEQIDKYNRDRKANTLARALTQYSGGVYSPQPEQKAPPSAPSMYGPAVLSGVGEAMSSAAPMVAGMGSGTGTETDVQKAVGGAGGMGKASQSILSPTSTAGSINTAQRKRALESRLNTIYDPNQGYSNA